MFINDLPEEILIEIFSYLTHVELFFVARKVCSLWNDVCMSSQLWSAIDVDQNLLNITRVRHSPIFCIVGRTSNEILTRILLEIKDNIRKLSFNTALVPLTSTNEGNRKLGPLHCLICNILFTTSDTKTKLNWQQLISMILSTEKRKNEKSCVNIHCGPGSGDSVHEAVQENHVHIDEPFSKRKFDLIVINEALKPLNFVQLHKFLSRVKVKVLGISTSQVFADVSNESLGNLQQMNGLMLRVKFYSEELLNPYIQRRRGQHYARDVEMESTFRFLFENLQNVNKLITDVINSDALRALLKNNRKLRHLSLQRCDKITEDVFANMPVLDHLVHLEISSCSRITDNEIDVIANCCKNLRHINLNRCVSVTHIGIKLLIQKCVWLTELHADGKPFKEFVTYFEMIETNRVSKHIYIRKLSLEFFFENGEITDNFVTSIANLCPDIRELYLRGQYLLTDIGIEYVIQKCKDLKIVDIWKGEKSTTNNEGSVYGGVKITKAGDNVCKKFLAWA